MNLVSKVNKVNSDSILNDWRQSIIKETNASQNQMDMHMKQNMYLVIEEARRLTGSGITLPQLITSGNEGLKKAISTFNETIETDFKSYATKQIRQAINENMVEMELLKPILLNRIGLLTENLKKIKRNAHLMKVN